jgi:GNAT superfamily N-acetyltransferase
MEPFSGEHLERCARLFVAAFGGEPWNEPWTLEAATLRLREIGESPGAFGLVCLMGDEVLGFAAGCLWQHAGGKLYYLHEMCVEEEWRGRGVGSVLLGDLEGELEGKASRVFLLTARGTPSEAFYARNGYRSDPSLTAMLKDL